MNAQNNNQHWSRVKNIGLWVLQILTATAFLLAGLAKLSGQPAMVAQFDQLGLGQWFRYLTGAIEVVSALLLLTPRLVAVGAALLVGTMAGAVLSHLVQLGGSPVPALVLGCFAAIILWGRFAIVKAWLVKLPASAAFMPKSSQTGDGASMASSRLGRPRASSV